MRLENKEIVQLINKEKFLITVLFVISATFGSVLIYLFNNKIYFGVGVFCYILAIICLPKINKAKQDILDAKNNNFNNVSGIIEALFPEKESDENGRWIVLVKDITTKKTHEYILSKKIEFKLKSRVNIQSTKNTNIPVRIEELKNEEVN